jgi:hypothetical protein
MEILKNSAFIIFCLIFCSAALGNDTTARAEPDGVLAAVSAKNYHHSIGLTGINPGIAYRQWFTDRSALQITVGKYAFNRPNVEIMGIRSFGRSTYFRSIGFAGLGSGLNTWPWVTVSLGVGLEYYIGWLGQSLAWQMTSNQFEFWDRAGIEYGMFFRF